MTVTNPAVAAAANTGLYRVGQPGCPLPTYRTRDGHPIPPTAVDVAYMDGLLGPPSDPVLLPGGVSGQRIDLTEKGTAYALARLAA